MIACRHAQLNITAHTSPSCGLTLEGSGDARVRCLRLAVHADRQTEPEDVVTVLVEWRVVVAVLGLVVAWQTSGHDTTKLLAVNAVYVAVTLRLDYAATKAEAYTDDDVSGTIESRMLERDVAGDAHVSRGEEVSQLLVT